MGGAKTHSFNKAKVDDRDSVLRCPCLCTGSPHQLQKHSTSQGGDEKLLVHFKRDFREELGRARFLGRDIRIIHLPLPGFQKNCRILAGFNRDFRFTGQKHICAAHKNECRADANTENQQLKGKHS